MNDKSVAAMAALAVAPIVVICCLGPIVLGSAMLGGIAGWLVGWGALEIVVAALVVAIVLPLGILVHRRRTAPKGASSAPESLRRSPPMQRD
jgi:uncharacterized membrane protein